MSGKEPTRVPAIYSSVYIASRPVAGSLACGQFREPEFLRTLHNDAVRLDSIDRTAEVASQRQVSLAFSACKPVASLAVGDEMCEQTPQSERGGILANRFFSRSAPVPLEMSCRIASKARHLPLSGRVFLDKPSCTSHCNTFLKGAANSGPLRIAGKLKVRSCGKLYRIACFS